MFEENILDFILVILLFESVKSALMYKQLRLILPVSPSISADTGLSSATSAILRKNKQNLVWDGKECRRTSSELHSYDQVTNYL